MTHEELNELYELYLLGALEPEEKAEVEQHLARACPECQAGVHRALMLTASFAAIADDVEPPRRLRKRILASVGTDSHRGWLAVAGLSLASLALFIALVITAMGSARKTQELESLQARLRTSDTELMRVQAAFRFLDEPETRQVVFGKGKPQPPRGRVFVNPQRGVLLIASDLPQLPAGKIFQMWLLPKHGAPVPAGLFSSDPSNNALYLRPVPFDPLTTAAVAVTVEPASGSAAPTSAPIIAAGLSE